MTGAPAEADTESVPVRRVHPLRGVVLFLCALFVFACMDSITKYLTAHYNVPLVVAVRYIVHCLLMVIVLGPLQGRALVQTNRTGLVLLRGACLTAMSLLIATALSRMPVAEVTAITFVSPIVVVLLAGPLLSERIGAVAWIAAVGGFLGVLLIVRPGAGLDPFGVACCVLGIAGSAAYQLLSRVLAHTERAIAQLFYTALIGAICFGLFLPWSWGGETPDALTLALFAGTGILAGTGHLLFTMAYRDTTASVLAPLNYAQLLWAGLLGWLVFEHVPDALSIAGMGIVAVSGALAAIPPRRRTA